MIVGIAIVIVFIIGAVLMGFRKLPAVFILPLLALVVTTIEAAAGHFDWFDIAYWVLADGALRFADLIIASMFGGMLAVFMQRSGVAENFARRGAELSGENPWLVAVVMLGMIGLLFTTIGGLGSVIMVGSIVLPILSAIGVRKEIGGGIVLFGIALGSVLNPMLWSVVQTMTGVNVRAITAFGVWMFGVIAAAAILFITIEIWRSGAQKITGIAVVRVLGWFVILGLVGLGLNTMLHAMNTAGLVLLCKWIVLSIVSIIVLLALRDYYRARRSGAQPSVHWYAFGIPLIPLLLVLLFDVPVVPAFAAGIVYGILVTLRRGTVNMTFRSMIEGCQTVVPVAVLLIGLGILLNAVLGPPRTDMPQIQYAAVQSEMLPAAARAYSESRSEWPVIADMKPLLGFLAPRSFPVYLLLLGALVPFVLYRGPFNTSGLGYLFGGVFLASGMPPGAVMGMLVAFSVVQEVSDPTSVQNIWLANELHLDIDTLMWKTLPYTWSVALIGLILAVFKFYL